MERPEDIKEDELNDETLKKEFEQKLEESGDDHEESSTEEKSPSEPSSEDVKPVTDKKQLDVKKEVSEVVPYSRFKEVNEKADKLQQQLERLEKQHPGRVRRNADGELELVEQEETKHEPDPDDITEEEKLIIGEDQLRIIEKVASRREKQAIQRINQERQYWNEAQENFEKAKKKFPELADAKSEMWKRSDKIIRDKYTTWSKDRKTYFVPPNAQYLAALEANEEIRSEKETLEKAKKEELTNKKQNTIVETKSRKAPIKKERADEEEFENLSREQQEAEMQEEYNKNVESMG